MSVLTFCLHMILFGLFKCEFVQLEKDKAVKCGFAVFFGYLNVISQTIIFCFQFSVGSKVATLLLIIQK